MNTKLNLSELFKSAVVRHGSQCEVAKRCGITQTMVSLFVTGKKRDIHGSDMIKIAHCLGVKVSVLIKACHNIDANTP